MNSGLSITFLVVGIVLLIAGISSYRSASSTVSRFFTGAPSTKSLGLLITGLVLGLIGLVGLINTGV